MRNWFWKFQVINFSYVFVLWCSETRKYVSGMFLGVMNLVDCLSEYSPCLMILAFKKLALPFLSSPVCLKLFLRKRIFVNATSVFKTSLKESLYYSFLLLSPVKNNKNQFSVCYNSILFNIMKIAPRVVTIVWCMRPLLLISTKIRSISFFPILSILIFSHSASTALQRLGSGHIVRKVWNVFWRVFIR